MKNLKKCVVLRQDGISFSHFEYDWVGQLSRINKQRDETVKRLGLVEPNKQSKLNKQDKT